MNMFYDQDLLNAYRNGRFSQCWLAATCPSIFKKTFCLSKIVEMRVYDLCEDILQMWIAESDKMAHKKMSLFLVSQLMYGSTCIYKRQVDALYDDVTNFLNVETTLIRNIRQYMHTPIFKVSSPAIKRTIAGTLKISRNSSHKKVKKITSPLPNILEASNEMITLREQPMQEYCNDFMDDEDEFPALSYAEQLEMIQLFKQARIDCDENEQPTNDTNQQLQSDSMVDVENPMSLYAMLPPRKRRRSSVKKTCYDDVEINDLSSDFNTNEFQENFENVRSSTPLCEPIVRMESSFVTPDDNFHQSILDLQSFNATYKSSELGSEASQEDSISFLTAVTPTLEDQPEDSISVLTAVSPASEGRQEHSNSFLSAVTPAASQGSDEDLKPFDLSTVTETVTPAEIFQLEKSTKLLSITNHSTSSFTPQTIIKDTNYNASTNNESSLRNIGNSLENAQTLHETNPQSFDIFTKPKLASKTKRKSHALDTLIQIPIKKYIGQFERTFTTMRCGDSVGNIINLNKIKLVSVNSLSVPIHRTLSTELMKSFTRKLRVSASNYEANILDEILGEDWNGENVNVDVKKRRNKSYVKAPVELDAMLEEPCEILNLEQQCDLTLIVQNRDDEFQSNIEYRTHQITDALANIQITTNIFAAEETIEVNLKDVTTATITPKISKAEERYEFGVDGVMSNLTKLWAKLEVPIQLNHLIKKGTNKKQRSMVFYTLLNLHKEQIVKLIHGDTDLTIYHIDKGEKLQTIMQKNII